MAALERRNVLLMPSRDEFEVQLQSMVNEGVSVRSQKAKCCCVRPTYAARDDSKVQ